MRELRAAGVAYVIWNRGALDVATWQEVRASYARHARASYADDSLVIWEIR